MGKIMKNNSPVDQWLYDVVFPYCSSRQTRVFELIDDIVIIYISDPKYLPP